MIESIGLVIIVAILTYISENVIKENIISPVISRKLLHIVVVSLAAFSPFVINNKTYLLIIGSVAVITTFFLVSHNILRAIEFHERKSWGIFFIALSYFILTFFFFEIKWIITLSLLITALSDSLACLVGYFWESKKYNLTGTEKSYAGSIVFFFTSMIILLLSRNILVGLFPNFIPQANFEPFTFLVFAFSLSTLLTILEAVSSRGSGNFTVPLLSSIVIYTLAITGSPELIYNFFVGISFAGIIAYTSFKLRFLSASGSAATFLLAGLIFGFGGWKWSVPILAFFILSSVLSKIRKRNSKNVEAMFEKTSVRDHWQVLANGGIGGGLILVNQLFPHEINYALYVASLAAVCADTWATEIGTFKNADTYNILNFKPIEQGTSGGVSMIGTLGAFLGAFVISLSGINWIEQGKLTFVFAIIAAGVIGSLFDSYLGATIQAQFRCERCEKITEKKIHCEQTTVPHKGLLWMNNDLVNLCAGISGVVVIFFLLNIF